MKKTEKGGKKVEGISQREKVKTQDTLRDRLNEIKQETRLMSSKERKDSEKEKTVMTGKLSYKIRKREEDKEKAILIFNLRLLFVVCLVVFFPTCLLCCTCHKKSLVF